MNTPTSIQSAIQTPHIATKPKTSGNQLPTPQITTCATCLNLSHQRKHLLNFLIKPHIAMADHQLTIDSTTNIVNDPEKIIQTPLYEELNRGSKQEGYLLKDCEYCVKLLESFISTLHLIHAHFIVQQDEKHFTCHDKPCTKLCFFNAEDLHSHWQSEHYVIPVETKENPNKRYLCSHQLRDTAGTCNASFNDFVQFKIHQLTHTSNRSIFGCSVKDCGLFFLTSAELVLHHNTHHTQQVSSTT